MARERDIFDAMEIDPNDIAELTTLVFAAALHPERWPDFVQRLHEISDGARTHIFGRDMKTGRLFGFVGAGYDDSHMEEYQAHFRHLNVWVDGFADVADGTYVPTAEMYPREKLFRTEFYNDWVRPQENIYGGGGVMLFNEKERFLAFGGHVRERDIDRIESRFETWARLLTPHIQQAFQINRALEGKELAEFIAQRDGAALVLLRQDGRVLFSNAAAEVMVAAGEWLRIDRSGRLRSGNRKLSVFLGQMLEGLRGPDGTASGELPLDGYGEQMMFRAARFVPDRQRKSPFGILHSGDERCLMLTIERREGSQQPVHEVLRRHRLTGAEIEIAFALGAGASAREVAERRGVSVHTVRNQRQAILSKLDFRRQAQLVQFLSQGIK